MTRRANIYIVRTFPKVSANLGGPTFGKYCKYKLIKFKPWEGKPSHAWDDNEDTDDMFINTYGLFLQTDFAKENVFGYSVEKEMLLAAQSDQSFGTDESGDESDNDIELDTNDEERVEDWMLLSRINEHYEKKGNQIANNEAVDWLEAARALPGDLLKEAPGWVSKKKMDAKEQGLRYGCIDQQIMVNLDTLNEKQRLAFDIITTQAGDIHDCEPVCMIVCGTAGTGKTYLINALRQVLRDPCIITTTTGIAAFSINGQTLHSAAQLRIHDYRELQGDSMQRLQLRLEGKRFLIVDEMSMIGHKMLSWLDNRLCAGTKKEDVPFGGMSVVLICDFGQLPPVGDTPMYISGNGTVTSDHGDSLFLSFKSVIIVEQVMRQAGEDPEAILFTGLLMRMRDGQVTENDWKLVLEHSTTNVPMDTFSHAIRLFFDKKSVAEYNYEKLLEMRQPVVILVVVQVLRHLMMPVA